MTLHSLTKSDDEYVCRVCTGGPWPSTTRAAADPCVPVESVQPVNMKSEETPDG